MLKKVFVSVFILMIIVPTAKCQQLQQSQLNGMMQGQQNLKVYNSHGSLQYSLKKQSNGTIKQYSKTGSYEATYIERAGKVIYYPKH